MCEWISTTYMLPLAEIFVGKICSRITSHTDESGEHKGRYNSWQCSLYGQNLVYIGGGGNGSQIMYIRNLKK